MLQEEDRKNENIAVGDVFNCAPSVIVVVWFLFITITASKVALSLSNPLWDRL